MGFSGVFWGIQALFIGLLQEQVRYLGLVQIRDVFSGNVNASRYVMSSLPLKLQKFELSFYPPFVSLR